MTGRGRARALLVALAVVAGGSWPAVSGAAGGAEPAAPTLAVDRARVEPDEVVVVTLTGWTGRSVTLSVCGNGARRGSADCDMVGSLGVGLSRRGPVTQAEFAVSRPPGTCPCVIRAADAGHTEVAVVPVELIGVPVGPLVDPAPERTLAVSVRVRRDRGGLLAAARATLGGPTRYEVTVTVENRSARAVRHLALSGSAGRRATDDVRILDLSPPDQLGPGERWEEVVSVALPAPALGRFVWQVTASGAGPTARAEAATRHVPVGLLVLVSVLVVDVAMIVVRFVRRRRPPVPTASDPAGRPGPPAAGGTPGGAGVPNLSPVVHGPSSSLS